jgi:hypothetical protein
MTHYKVGPIVDASQGDMTEFVPGFENQKLETFHMVLEDWNSNDIVTTSPGFAVTRPLADRLAQSDLSGFELKDMYLSISENGTRAMREKGALIPELIWLDVDGADGEADFFLTKTYPPLVVSERALALLQEFNLANADIEDYAVQ